MSMTVDEAVRRGPPPPARQPDHEVPQVGASNLEDLLKIVRAHPRAPRLGVEASEMMKRCYETAASDIERVAADQVQRSLDLQQEAQTFATILRDAGERFCRRIEAEATRTYRTSTLMKEIDRLLADAPSDPPEPEVPGEGAETA